MTFSFVLCLVASVAQAPPKFAPWVDPSAALETQDPATKPAPKPPPPPPDIIVLNNGDKVTGQVQKMVNGKLVVKTTYAGDVTIDWKEIRFIQLGTSQEIKLRNSDAVKGKLMFSGQGMHVFETDDITLRGPVKLDSVIAINEPPPKWTGFLRVNIVLEAGNTKSTLFGGSIEVKHETDKHLFKAYGRTSYKDEDNVLTEQTSTGGALYDYYFTERWFTEVYGEMKHDKFEDLDLRLILGAAIGYAFIKEPDMRLTGDVGPAWVEEHHHEAFNDSFAAIKFGETFTWKIDEAQSLNQLVRILPNTERFSDYLVHFQASYRNLLGVAGLFLDTTAIDDYDNEPVDGTQRNDFQFILSLGVNF